MRRTSCRRRDVRSRERFVGLLCLVFALTGCGEVALSPRDYPAGPRFDTRTYVIPVTVHVDDVQPMGQFGYILDFQCDPVDSKEFWHFSNDWAARPYYPTKGPPWHFKYEVKRHPSAYDVSCDYSLMYEGESRVQLLPDGSIDPAEVVIRLEPEEGTVRTTIALKVTGPDDADLAVLRTRPIECDLNPDGEDKVGPDVPIGVPATGFPIEVRYDVRLHYGPHAAKLWHGKGQLTGEARFNVEQDGSITPPVVEVAMTPRAPSTPENDPIGAMIELIKALKSGICQKNAELRPTYTAWALSSLNASRKQMPKLLFGDSIDKALEKRIPMLRKWLDSKSEVLRVAAATVLLEIDKDSSGRYIKIVLGLDKYEDYPEGDDDDGRGEKIYNEARSIAFRNLRSKKPEHRMRGLMFCTLVKGGERTSLWDRLTSDDAEGRRGAVKEINEIAGMDVGIDPDRFREWAAEVEWGITEEGIVEFVEAGEAGEAEEDEDDEKVEPPRGPTCPYDSKDLAATGEVVTAALDEARRRGVVSVFPTLEKLPTLQLRHIIWAARRTRAEGMPDPYSVFELGSFRSAMVIQAAALLLTERKDSESYRRILELTEANIDWLMGFPATTLENMGTPEAVELLRKNARSRTGIMNVIWSVDSLVRMGHSDAFKHLFDALDAIEEDTWSPWDEPMPDEDKHASSEIGLLTMALSDFVGVDKAVSSKSSKEDGANAVKWWREWWKQNADKELPFLKTWPRKQWSPKSTRDQ